MHPDPASLRCADTDREGVAEILGRAYADGRLDRDEHAERLEAVWAARTFGELTPLTADLGHSPVLPSPHLPEATAHALATGRGALVDPRAASTDTDRVVSVMGSAKRSGHWRLRRETRSVAVMGEVLLDLREAVFEADECHINLPTVMGEVTIRVPDGVQVENRTTAVMGEVQLRGLGAPTPGAPRSILTGPVVMGSVKVLGPNHQTLTDRILGR